MGGYLANFSVYAFAMIGFLFVAVAIYKKTSTNSFNSAKNGGMEIEDSLSLSPRKRLHVVKVNGQKFLIAADLERTEFLAKLDCESHEQTPIQNNIIKFNKHPQLFSGQENKVASLLKRVEEKQNSFPTQGNAALNISTKPQIETKLSHIKNINMKKPPMMREILRKLEIPQG